MDPKCSLFTCLFFCSNRGVGVQESAKKLGLESIDLVLPHWPGIGTDIELARQNAILRRQTWKALEDLQRESRKEIEIFLDRKSVV